jgi:hypothetical protein
VIREAARRLDGQSARCVVVGPDLGNNAEWFSDLGRLFEVSTEALAVAGFGRQVALPALLDVFGTVTCAVFRTVVTFADLDSLMRYYDACRAYCPPDRRDDARQYFARLFERDGAYRVTKRSLGLVARARRGEGLDG